MIPYAVNDIITPAPLSNIKLGGYPAAKAKAFFDRRILSQHAREDVFREAEVAFSERIDDATDLGYWRGEFWGKLALSAVRVCRYLGDENLKNFIRESAYRVIATQDPDGYIGTYKNADFVQSPDVNLTEKLVGWKCDWCWNIWCRKYTLWGLIECYELLADENILAAAVKMADHLIAQLHRLGLTLRDTGTFNGLPSGSIIKPMLQLYRHTGDKKYLELCIATAEDWDRPDGAIPNLIANARTGKPIHEWYPNSDKWAKAYEMMSCLDGLIELHRITGTPKYLEAAVQIQSLLAESELNVLFSVGYNDVFAHAASQINAITEPCDVIHWMRLNYELFKLTGKAEYMDFFERAYMNAFLASSFRDGDWGARCVRTSGRQMIAHQCGFEHNHCCVDNMPRGYMNAAEAAVMRGADGIYVNLYTEIAADLGDIQVGIGSGYAQTSAADITITAERPTTVYFRIPGWSCDTLLTINGTACEPTQGLYAEATLNAGKNRIHVQFDACHHIYEWSRDIVPLPSDDWRVRRWCNHTNDPFGALGAVPEEYMNWQRKCYLMKGPILLAMSKNVGETEANMFAPSSVDMHTPVTLTSINAEGTWCAYEAEFATQDGIKRAKLCDYASAADEILDDPAYFTIWL